MRLRRCKGDRGISLRAARGHPQHPERLEWEAWRNGADVKTKVDADADGHADSGSGTCQSAARSIADGYALKNHRRLIR